VYAELAQPDIVLQTTKSRPSECDELRPLLVAVPVPQSHHIRLEDYPSIGRRAPGNGIRLRQKQGICLPPIVINEDERSPSGTIDTMSRDARWTLMCQSWPPQILILHRSRDCRVFGGSLRCVIEKRQIEPSLSSISTIGSGCLHASVARLGSLDLLHAPLGAAKVARYKSGPGLAIQVFALRRTAVRAARTSGRGKTLAETYGICVA